MVRMLTAAVMLLGCAGSPPTPAPAAGLDASTTAS